MIPSGTHIFLSGGRFHRIQVNTQDLGPQMNLLREYINSECSLIEGISLPDFDLWKSKQQRDLNVDQHSGVLYHPFSKSPTRLALSSGKAVAYIKLGEWWPLTSFFGLEAGTEDMYYMGDEYSNPVSFRMTTALKLPPETWLIVTLNKEQGWRLEEIVVTCYNKKDKIALTPGFTNIFDNGILCLGRMDQLMRDPKKDLSQALILILEGFMCSIWNRHLYKDHIHPWARIDSRGFPSPKDEMKQALSDLSTGHYAFPYLFMTGSSPLLANLPEIYKNEP